CQELREEWRQLDSELSLEFARQQLSGSFASRLFDRIEEQTSPASRINQDECKARAEAELEQHWNEYRKSFLRAHIPAFLDHLGYGAVAAVAAYFLFRAVNILLNS